MAGFYIADKNYLHRMISIVIPTYNEAAIIAQLVTYLQLYGCNTIAEIIVIDGGSDDTLRIAAQLGVITAKAVVKGRAAQMNQGAAMASGSILYFVHADTLPPQSFTEDITGCHCCAVIHLSCSAFLWGYFCNSTGRYSK